MPSQRLDDSCAANAAGYLTCTEHASPATETETVTDADDADLATDGEAEPATDGETETTTDETATTAETATPEPPTSDAKSNGEVPKRGVSEERPRARQPRRVAASTHATHLGYPKCSERSPSGTAAKILRMSNS